MQQPAARRPPGTPQQDGGAPERAPAGLGRCQVDGRDVTPEWRGNRLVFEGLRGGERLVVQAPVSLESVKQTVVNIADPHNSSMRYEIEFKGHTALSALLISPPAEKSENDPNWYRIFRRETMRSAQPLLKPAPAYVHPETLVHWTV